MQPHRQCPIVILRRNLSHNHDSVPTLKALMTTPLKNSGLVVGLAALLLLGKRLWPGIALGAFLASLTAPEMAGVKAGPALAASLGVALGSTLAAWLGAALAQRFARGRAAFERPSTVFRFLALTAILSTTISPTVALGSLWLAGLI